MEKILDFILVVLSKIPNITWGLILAAPSIYYAHKFYMNLKAKKAQKYDLIDDIKNIINQHNKLLGTLRANLNISGRSDFLTVRAELRPLKTKYLNENDLSFIREFVADMKSQIIIKKFYANVYDINDRIEKNNEAYEDFEKLYLHMGLLPAGIIIFDISKNTSYKSLKPMLQKLSITSKNLLDTLDMFSQRKYVFRVSELLDIDISND